ncbi:MAG: hypothetical protein JXB36_00270, partial [Gammaproteobacteria bacterium]|nr:hypothetical protein [Gammaproteobacteria bacterium]
MDDDFLHGFRQNPPPEFARRLRASLREGYAGTADRPTSKRFFTWASMAASIAVVSVAFTLPSVRAGAQAFLDLFRVAGFVGVSFDAERLRAMESF